MKKTVVQLVRFCMVGTIGFVVDVSILYAVVNLFDSGPYFGRVVSYIFAATITWKLNRSFTFLSTRSNALHLEWARYLLSNIVGATINYGVYVLCLIYFNLTIDYLIIGVAAGSIAGLAVNFTISKLWIFKTDKQENSSFTRQ